MNDEERKMDREAGMVIVNPPNHRPFAPLDEVFACGDLDGILAVRDGMGREYVRRRLENGKASFRVGGAIGWQSLVLLDEQGATLATTPFRVDCETAIADREGRWTAFDRALYWNIHKAQKAYYRFNGKTWFTLCIWLRDHVHHLKGEKYYQSRLREAIDLFADAQLPDGMVFDFYWPTKTETPASRYADPRFTRVVPDDGSFFQRVPVENDVEYLFVEGIYQTWRITGDDAWLKRRLDNAERALTYNLTSPYCWSEKYRLLKRALTIDTWDFMPHDQAALVGGDIMEVIPGKTRFGIFHGDNTGFADACRHLAAMHERVGCRERANFWRQTAADIAERLTRLSWNDRFFAHWVPEDQDFSADYGVDMSEQMSLSNALALNRDIAPEQAQAIIESYRRLRDEATPPGGPGEFYGIYPPFERGFHFRVWHYVNGGVFPFIGGELALGAFRHGYEAYGADILDRLRRLLARHDNQMPYYYIGRKEPEPERSFSTIDLSDLANVDISGQGAPGVPGWEGKGCDNDFAIMPVGRQVYHCIPFAIADPARNGRRCCIALTTGKSGYLEEIRIPVRRQAASVYILHNMAGTSFLAGWLTFRYDDGTVRRQYVRQDRHIKNWWDSTDVPYNRNEGWVCRVAFQGRNQTTRVASFVWGLDNPEPEKTIDEMVFTHSQLPHTWFIFGVTLCDRPVWFEAADLIHGHLSSWNSGCVVQALIEGLAGITNNGIGYNRATIAPRWAAAGTDEVACTAKHPETGHYVSYTYRLAASRIALSVAATHEDIRVEVLLPPSQRAVAVSVDGKEISYEHRHARESVYAVFALRGLGCQETVIKLAPETNVAP